MKYFVLALSLVVMVFTSTPLNSATDYEVFVPPPKELVYFTFGFNGAIASMLWLRLLQDMDICDQTDNEKSLNPSINVDRILEYDLSKSRCDEGWVYTMIDRITDLSPNFLYAYYHGGLVLSVLVDDRLGAKKIFDKGLSVYPDDYQLVYSAAYHYLFEMQDAARAAELLAHTHKLGGPDWVLSLAANLYNKTNQKTLGILILQDFIAQNPNSPATEYLKQKLEKLKNE